MKYLKTSLLFFGILLSSSTFSYIDSYPYNYGEYVDLDYSNLVDPPPRPSGVPFTSAILKYGKSVITEGEFTAEASYKPWTSWWYPKYDRRIFENRTNEDGQSTLARYDELSKTLNSYTGSSRDYEEANVYDPTASKWAGLCHAWAVAAIMEPEPVKPTYKNGIKFRVQDLKALLIKTYESSNPGEAYGQRNNAEYDSVYEDIYPEQFHRIMEAELYEKKTPFIMDFDAGFQVWNVPVYSTKLKIKRDEQDQGLVHVKLNIDVVSPFVEDPNFVGMHLMTMMYTYDLYGSWDSSNKFTVDYGVWTGRSRNDHPDFVTVKPEKVERITGNKFIDIKIVDEILQGSR